jgi:hypothetical protein
MTQGLKRTRPAAFRSKSLRLLFAITSVTSTLSLGACRSELTEPELDQSKPRANLVCILRDANGQIIEIREVESGGGCANGFDLHTWI